MYIGKLAELTGATPKAIRLYENMRLIPVPRRRGNYRVYSEQHVILVRMIRRAQNVGFNLAELKEIVQLKAESNSFPLTQANALIEEKSAKLEQQIVELQQRQHQLRQLRQELNDTFA